MKSSRSGKKRTPGLAALLARLKPNERPMALRVAKKLALRIKAKASH